MWNEEEDVIVIAKEEKLYVHKLSDLEELRGVFAYKLDVCYDGKVLSSREGIITNSELILFVNDGIFKNNFGYELVDVELFEKALRDPKLRSVPENCYILKPYTANIKFDKNKHALIKDKIGYTGNIDDFLGNYHSIGVHMDYINGNISESHYDLEKLLEVLKNRDDVVFVKDAKIEQIPYYNNEEGRSETINFIWYPNAEDYKKCLTDNHFRADLAATNVFGLERKEFEY